MLWFVISLRVPSLRSQRRSTSTGLQTGHPMTSSRYNLTISFTRFFPKLRFLVMNFSSGDCLLFNCYIWVRTNQIYSEQEAQYKQRIVSHEGCTRFLVNKNLLFVYVSFFQGLVLHNVWEISQENVEYVQNCCPFIHSSIFYIIEKILPGIFCFPVFGKGLISSIYIYVSTIIFSIVNVAIVTNGLLLSNLAVFKQKLSESQQPENSLAVVKILRNRPTNWADCITSARIKFEKYFNHRVCLKK